MLFLQVMSGKTGILKKVESRDEIPLGKSIYYPYICSNIYEQI